MCTCTCLLSLTCSHFTQYRCGCGNTWRSKPTVMQKIFNSGQIISLALHGWIDAKGWSHKWTHDSRQPWQCLQNNFPNLNRKCKALHQGNSTHRIPRHRPSFEWDMSVIELMQLLPVFYSQDLFDTNYNIGQKVVSTSFWKDWQPPKQLIWNFTC